MEEPIPGALRIQGEIADYFLTEEGILLAWSKPVCRTVDLIRENGRLVHRITGDKPVPILIHLCPSPVPDKATRNFSTEQLPKLYRAMAMVSTQGLSHLIMSLLFRFKTPPIPMRSFTQEKDALKWLRSLESNSTKA